MKLNVEDSPKNTVHQLQRACECIVRLDSDRMAN